MPIGHIMSNTDRDYPCVQCGSSQISIIRESADPRVKCNKCNMVYDASQSLAAKEAGEIPDGPPTIQETPARRPHDRVPGPKQVTRDRKPASAVVPRTPSYVLVTKDRNEVVFCTKRDFKANLLKWTAQEKKFNVYELHPKEVVAKIDIN